jgi:nucleotidyltransferase/DNA polymerase involved in DNA repair
MRYRIEAIEGIGRACGSKLRTAGISSKKDLLEHCVSAKGRRQVAATSGLDEGHLPKWANLADLIRARRIGKQFFELLEAAGIDTVKDLRTRRADHLAARMNAANAKRKLTRATPSERRVVRWIDQAKRMDAMITH